MQGLPKKKARTMLPPQLHPTFNRLLKSEKVVDAKDIERAQKLSNDHQRLSIPLARSYPSFLSGSSEAFDLPPQFVVHRGGKIYVHTVGREEP